MAQGKLKVKSKLPPSVKNKKPAQKGKAVTQRANCPIKPKKQKHQEAQKLKQVVTKSVNKSVEEEMRSRAYEGKRPLSKAQEAVANYHKEMGPSKT
ncbi:hypothetical protein PPYR_14441 [Photinus pyralis]|uniref:Uncharacterized protein n=1 Tax=Photinus pyralis TaxID=7054 RepID=A0A5N4A5A0_PHOPY|nr:uncharacterized protein LOC116180563 [Photinus pyralis]KAB0792482.1 hypothetical protein PPYR_14441 [Photinus pyralis]